MLVAAGVVLRLLLPTSLRVQVLHHMSHRVSVCVRPNCSTPPRVDLVVRLLRHHIAILLPICVQVAPPTPTPQLQVSSKTINSTPTVVGGKGGRCSFLFSFFEKALLQVFTKKHSFKAAVPISKGGTCHVEFATRSHEIRVVWCQAQCPKKCSPGHCSGPKVEMPVPGTAKLGTCQSSCATSS